MFWTQLAITGFATGCIYALAGLGLVLTYKATGVFNFAHGSIGLVVAYALYQLNVEWGWPMGVAAPIAILVVGPAIGLALERFVFRPLARRGATTAEKLVASLGVFVLLFGVVFYVYTGEARTAPLIFPSRSFELPGGYIMSWDQLAQIVITIAVAGGLWALFRFTHLGTEIRAVVDRPELAQLASINANRVAGIAWAIGAGLAGLSGALLVNLGGVLDPKLFPLFLLEMFSMAVVARLTSVPVAVGAGVLLLGVGKAWLGEAEIFNAQGVIGSTFELIKPYASGILLFVALLVYRRLDVQGEATERRVTGTGGGRARIGRAGIVGTLVVAAVLVVLPGLLTSSTYSTAHRFLAFTAIFASIVAVTGFSGQITLGQAGFAGLGAFAAARIANQFDVPVLVAMALGGLAAAAGGFLAGWPALRRRGLFLALTTVAFGLIIYYGVLENSTLAGDARGLDVARPSLFGLDLSGPTAFYYFELVVVALLLLFTRNIRQGRLGRALRAMRDSEAGAQSVGIDLRAYKLFIFTASAFIAGVGGALLTQQAGTFDGLQFFPLNSLFWFAFVVVAGVGDVSGAVLAAFLYVFLDRIVGTEGASQALVGFAAVALGRLPGGSLIGVTRTLTDHFVHAARTGFGAAVEASRPRPPRPALGPTDFARDVLAHPLPVPGGEAPDPAALEEATR